ncbi:MULTISPECIES: SDR family oxidoreductase [Rhodomicrobium]|uniref:SDR family oxidoreductase n=1 Tax=Rhodomicrobium TaxID=1068 RepID=UPI000B4AF60B|nr:MULTISPECIES: SDR family oxidoreductase [Rhodomicrobium]
MNTLLAIGLGYSATAIAADLKAEGWRIIGTARGADGVRAIEALGYEAIAFDGEAPSPALAGALRQATHLLLSAPPGADGDPVLRHHANDLAAASNLAWIGYLSTIGVYGDHGGAWVDETTVPKPISDRSRWRLGAEIAWAASASSLGVPLQVYRLAGIYGPGQNALERLLAGHERRIEKPGLIFNRTHRTDIAATVEAGIRAGGNAVGVFNVTDDEPAPPQDVVAYAADLLGVAPPPLVPFAQAELSPMARSFYAESKRARNDRIKRDLGVTLAYPTYREGLRALAAELKR